MSTKPPEMSYSLGCFRVSREHKPLRLPHQDTLQSPCSPYHCRIQAGLSKNVRLVFHESQHMRDQEPARKDSSQGEESGYMVLGWKGQ